MCPARAVPAMLVVPAANATWAIYYDEPLSAKAWTSTLPQGEPLAVGVDFSGSLVPASQCGENCQVQLLPSPLVTWRFDTELGSRRLGAAAAWKLGPLALGASLRYEELHERWRPHAPGTSIAFTELRDERFTWSAGAQWQITEAVRAGGSYRSGAAFPRPDGYFFRTPSSIALGVAADVRPNLTVAADAVRVRYNEMEGGSPLTVAGSYEFPDVTELHAGAELRLATRVPVALRAGWWRDPTHPHTLQTRPDQRRSREPRPARRR